MHFWQFYQQELCHSQWHGAVCSHAVISDCNRHSECGCRLEGFQDPWEFAVHRGRALKPEATLQECGITSDACITAVRRALVPEGMPSCRRCRAELFHLHLLCIFVFHTSGALSPKDGLRICINKQLNVSTIRELDFSWVDYGLCNPRARQKREILAKAQR